MIGSAVAMMIAAAFTAGCITIHELRQNASALTPPLAIIAVCLGVFVILVMMAGEPTPKTVATGAAPPAELAAQTR